jgi:hypothetical protein
VGTHAFSNGIIKIRLFFFFRFFTVIARSRQITGDVFLFDGDFDLFALFFDSHDQLLLTVQELQILRGENSAVFAQHRIFRHRRALVGTENQDQREHTTIQGFLKQKIHSPNYATACVVLMRSPSRVVRTWHILDMATGPDHCRGILQGLNRASLAITSPKN